jgi:hypothetical protein
MIVLTPCGNLPAMPETAKAMVGLERAARWDSSPVVRAGLAGETTAPTAMSTK